MYFHEVLEKWMSPLRVKRQTDRLELLRTRTLAEGWASEGN